MAKKVRIAKVVLCGDARVGKTSLRARYLGHGFKAQYIQTLGADFAIYDTEIDNTLLKWQIWDLAGHTKWSDVLKRYYHGSFGAIVVYDVTRAETLDNVFSWVRDVWKFNIAYQKKIPIVLLANKIDLKDNIVTTAEGGQEIADKLAIERNGPVIFLETSAKTGQRVKEAFEELGRLVIDFTSSLESK